MATAEIITIGTELLLGETADTNTRYIAQTLRSLGVDIFRTHTVGDNADRIATTVREALDRAEIIITTGGLGPTVDDPTRAAIAKAVGTELEFHPELWEQIVDRISRYGRKPTDNQMRQAYIPKGAIAIPNPVGTAPAFIIEFPNKQVNKSVSSAHVVITLPGVPREMETLLSNSVVPYLQEHFKLHDVIQVRTLHVSGIGEGALDDQIGDLEVLTNPTVGLTAHSGVVDIRIAAKATSPSQAAQMIAEVEKDLRRRLGEKLFGADTDTLEGITLDTLERKGWRLACFESSLGGMLLHRLAQANNATYLGGRQIDIGDETPEELALKIQGEFNSNAVLGLILIPGEDNHEVSMILIHPSGQAEQRQVYGGHPKNAGRWAVNTALDWLRLLARESGEQPDETLG